MMVKANYSDTANHKQIHKDFLAKIKSLKAPLDDASLKWAKEWWVFSLFPGLITGFYQILSSTLLFECQFAK